MKWTGYDPRVSPKSDRSLDIPANGNRTGQPRVGVCQTGDTDTTVT